MCVCSSGKEMQTLNRDIRERTFKRVYLLYGEEGFLKRSYKHRLKEAVLGDDTMNYHYFEGKGLSVPEILGLADTMPFFADRRMILIEDSGWFKSGAQEMADAVPDLPETVCMVFVEAEVDKRGRLFKAVKKYGYAAELARQSPAQLAKWAAGLLTREGKKITASTMDLLLSRTGEDMENIRSELDKLISYTLGREAVTAQDVEDICTARAENKIFDMITAISGRRTVQAMKLYEDLLILREPPMRILFLIARQFNQLLQVKELKGKGMQKAEIASRMKIPPFAAGKIMAQAGGFSREQLLSFVELCAETEEAVKQGRLSDRLAVELLICREYP